MEQNQVAQAVTQELDITTKIIDNTREFFLTRGIDFIQAIVIFMIGYFFCRKIKQGITHILERSNVDPSARSFIAEIVYFFTLAIVVLISLGTAGFNAGTLAAAFGGIGLAIALGLKDNIGNVASGIFILIFKPFKVGDYIELGSGQGTVKEIRIMYTVLSTLGNQMIVIPNSSLITSVIKNYSAYDFRNIEMTLDVGYDTNLTQCIEVLRNVFNESPYVYNKNELVLYISGMAESSIRIYVRAQVERVKYFEAQTALYIAIKKAFDESGIEIPFPQLVIHQAKD